MISSRSLALLSVLAFAPDALFAQTSPPASASSAQALPLKLRPRPTTAAISTADLMSRLYLFADDSMMGREAGTAGALKGTAYIAAEAKRLGLEPAGDGGGYFQNVPFIARTLDPKTTLGANGGTLVAYSDFVTIPFRGAEPRAIDGAEVVYGGAVGDKPGLTAEQAKGRFVVMRATPGLPSRIAATSPLAGAAGVAYVTGPTLAAATLATGRTATLTLPPDPKAPSALVALNITTGAAERLLGAPLEGLSVGAIGGKVQGSLRFVARNAPTRNVVAILRGSDPALRGQYVAIGAHSDHIGYRATGAVDHDSLHLYLQQRYLASENPTGKELTEAEQSATKARIAAIRVDFDSVRARHAVRRDSINNGADDDGSGTVTVLELAEAFARGRVKPKRSLLFVWHTGEEKGLLGSRYFTDHPTVPRDSIAAQINIDMVGRGATTDLREGGDRYLQLVGSRRLSTELGDLVERVNTAQAMPFRFDYTFDADGHPDNIYCRSDHYNYARYGIPVVFLTTGLHGDYHQVTDDPQYIDYAHMARVGGTAGERRHPGTERRMRGDD
ncbi:MAG: peptidase, partial [Gemmatimonadetes bacterium]|nr:peptidase [Gemmatimonadota bacterium]